MVHSRSSAPLLTTPTSSTHHLLVLPINSQYQITADEKENKDLLPLQADLKWCVQVLHRLCRRPLTVNAVQKTQPERPSNAFRPTTPTLNHTRWITRKQPSMRRRSLKYMRKTLISPSSLCVPIPCSRNPSDLASYQAVLYSAICAALVIYARSDSNEATEALGYFFSSSLISLLAALFALFAKERLNGFLLRDGGPMINRSAPGSRQNVYKLKTWRFSSLLKAPRTLLQTALLIPVVGFCGRLWQASPTVTCMVGLFDVVPAFVGYYLVLLDV